MPEAYLHRHRVTFDETNLVGNVYFAHFLHWQGHCREHFLADHAPGVLGALADGLALVTVNCAVYVVSGHIAGKTDTMPLRVEKLLQGYNLPGAFALASLLTLLALATLIVKVGLERKMHGNAAQALQSTAEELLVDARATIKESV